MTKADKNAVLGAAVKAEKMKRLYESVDELRKRYGKHTLYLGSSYYANQLAQHLGERGDIPERKETLFKGELNDGDLGFPCF